MLIIFLHTPTTFSASSGKEKINIFAYTLLVYMKRMCIAKNHDAYSFQCIERVFGGYSRGFGYY